ncbi:MAG: hypothetical protein QOE31_847 [Solirubrobacteraceae bacterium]|jgi:hypothetical protein|nr:hypothetical protein [Solirubrobacteraceae bacterium]
MLAVLLVSGGLSACGKHQSTGPVRSAETEGIYLDVSDLKYQVQVSRQLNPADVQDKAYLTGIPTDEQKLKADEVWFGVFMRVQNETGEALQPSDDIQITDTQDQVYKPVELGPENLYAYRAADAIPARETLPLLDSPGYDTPTRGALLLFKLTLTGLNNRPLEMKIEGRKVPQQTGIVNLDV